MTLFWRNAAVIPGSVLLLLTYAAAAQTSAAPTPSASPAPATTRKASHAARHSRGVSKPSPVPAPLQPPPPPPAPEQMAPVPPQVTYSNGLLTIVANNSTLSDILRAVAARTGATVDAPAHLTAERVAAHIGPGTPRDVLLDLLRGPGFDYILLGADGGDPNAVRSIILTPNQASPTAGAVMAQQQAVRPVRPPQEETEDEVAEEPQFQPGPENPQSLQQAPPTQQTFGPQQPYGPQLPPDQMGSPQPSFRGGQQPQVRTPEQLLEELRKMQQQGNQPQNGPQR